MADTKKTFKNSQNQKKITSCEGATARWYSTTFTLIRWQSIRTLYMREQLFNLNIQKKKIEKKI